MSPRVASALLWALAVILMLSAAVYQRLTGPTNPVRGSLIVDGRPERYRLLRSEESVRDARIAVPAPSAQATGRVYWRRYPTPEEFRSLDMRLEITREGRRELAAYLPAQPAAGKLEYRIEVDTPDGLLRIPAGEQESGASTLVMRYKDPVPLPLLLAHVGAMFFGMLVGIRAALGALLAPSGMHRLAWVALALLTLGGMILGPVVQKYAFGAFWTGFPFGYDLTDNKTLVMWLVWIGACAVLGWKPLATRPPLPTRLAVAAAGAVMTVVYLIPHSLRGSELDYSALESGIPAAEAVKTGGSTRSPAGAPAVVPE